MSEGRKFRWIDWMIRGIYIAIIVGLLLLCFPSPFARVQRVAVSPDDPAWQELRISGSRHAQRLQRSRLGIPENPISD
jgi:hypothetical protein